MVRIPSEYQEVEYLESTGTQYIDLPFGFDQTDEIEITGAMLNGFGDKYMVAPIIWNTDTNRFLMLGGVNNFFVFSFGSVGAPNSILTPAITGDTKMHTMTYSNKIFTVIDTGSVADMTSKSFGSTSANLRLFYGYSYNTKGKIAYYHHKKTDGIEVNLIPCYRKSDNEPGMYDTVSGAFYVNSGTGEFLVGNNVYYDTTNLLESRRRILLTTPHLESPTPANPLTFKSNMTTKLKEGKVYFTPVQEGTGDPSPDNVRPISGWDGISVTKCGKNLFDKSKRTESRLIDSTGSIYSNSSWFVTDFIPLQGTKVSCHGSRRANTTYHAFYDKNKQLVSVVKQEQINNLAIPSKARYIRCSCANEYVNAFQVELNSTPTSYEPYIETKITIPFPKTIYGGYVDLVNGEVVEEWESFVLDGEENNIREFNRGQSAHRFDFYLTNLHGSAKVASTEWLCDRMAYDSSSTALFGTFRMYNTTNLVIGNGDNTLADLAAFKQWLSKNTPEFCAPLATPVHHTITDGLTHLTLGESITDLPNGRGSTGGYANSTATGADGCKFIYFELGWPTETYLQYSADYSRLNEFKLDGYTLRTDITSWGTASAGTMNLGEFAIVQGSSTDFEEDPLVYVYISVPADCTDLEAKRAYFAEHPLNFTYPKKTPVSYTIDQDNLRPLSGTNNLWSDANGNIEVTFWKH